MKIARRLFKKASLLNRPTLACRDAPFPNKAAASEGAIVLCAVFWASERRENAAGGLFQ